MLQVLALGHGDRGRLVVDHARKIPVTDEEVPAAVQAQDVGAERRGRAAAARVVGPRQEEAPTGELAAHLLSL